MAELPILPLRTDALLADTMHMSAEEFGAYCRLLFTMWRHGAQLLDNQSELAKIVGVDKKKWKRIAPRVMRPMNTADGVIFQKRLTSTWLEVQELRKKRAKAASARWKPKKNANADANAMQLDAFCNANQIRKKDSTEGLSVGESDTAGSVDKAKKEPPRKEAKQEFRHGPPGTVVGPEVLR